MDDVAPIAAAIRRHRIDISNEKEAQRQIAQALDSAGLAAKREMRLSDRDRPDFFLPLFGLAIEVKLRGRKIDIWRQLVRYASHDRVHGLMLVSNTAMALPPDIDGKPLWFVSLGQAWL